MFAHLADKMIRVKLYQMPKGNFEIGKKIQELRIKEDFSQDELSKKTGLAYHTIAKIEAGATSDPRVKTAKKIADALGVTIDDLVK